ncbi:COP-II coat subunit [Perkinsela sp. CCAP 1560/4]|nr:COP-II coat subunit [Perkinsela sp. CCAP 1560/4]|eukprot:KNH07339.1 COP-II coat subunit [Perkinsela sp. CCAP 1560/4]
MKDPRAAFGAGSGLSRGNVHAEMERFVAADAATEEQNVYRFLPSLRTRFALPDDDDFFADCIQRPPGEFSRGHLDESAHNDSKLSLHASNAPVENHSQEAMELTESYHSREVHRRFSPPNEPKPPGERRTQATSVTPLHLAVRQSPVESSSITPTFSSQTMPDISPRSIDSVHILHENHSPSFPVGGSSEEKHQASFQCSFKSAKEAQPLDTSCWPANPIEVKKDDSDLIDLFFSSAESEPVEKPSPQSVGATEIGSEMNYLNISSTHTNTQNPSTASIYGTSGEGSNLQTYEGIRSQLQMRHGFEWSAIPFPDLMRSLREVAGSYREGLADEYHTALWENDSSHSMQCAENSHRWGDAFILAQAHGADAVGRVIGRYIQENEGMVHPIIHASLSFEYLAFDAKGVSQCWIDYLGIVMDRRLPHVNSPEFMNKLIDSLVRMGMTEEASVCASIGQSVGWANCAIEELTKGNAVGNDSRNQIENSRPVEEKDSFTGSDPLEIPSQELSIAHEVSSSTGREAVSSEVYHEKTREEKSLPKEPIVQKPPHALPKADVKSFDTSEKTWWPFPGKRRGSAKSIILPDDSDKPYFNPKTGKWEGAAVEEDTQDFQAILRDGPPQAIETGMMQDIGSRGYSPQDDYGMSRGLSMRYADTFNV